MPVSFNIKPKPADRVSFLVVVFEMLNSYEGISACGSIRPYLASVGTTTAKDSFPLLTWTCG